MVYWFQKPNEEEISMEKFIPYEKLSKKEKRKMDLAKRQTWGELNPVTRKPENSKAYNRKKSQAWKRELPPTACDFSCPVLKPYDIMVEISGYACTFMIK